MTTVLDRFLRYVRYDTQSDEASTTYPSTAKQLVLLRDLAAELKALGLADAAVDEFGYVTATIPATTTQAERADDRVHRARRHVAGDARRGREADRPPRATTAATSCCPTIRPPSSGSPTIRRSPSRSATTSSPRRARRCFGADNKAGVAEIVTAAAYLVAHPEIPHGPIRIAFTPDEEVGRGTTHISTSRASARAAPTRWTAAAAARSRSRAFRPTR